VEGVERVDERERVAGKAGREGRRLALWFYGGRRREGQVELRWLERERGREAFWSAHINKEVDPAATTLINGSFFWPIINIGQATLAFLSTNQRETYRER
jgi:hypothetical protein